MQNQHAHRAYDQVLPYLLVLGGLFVGLYAYFYLTSLESNVQRSLSSNHSPQSAVVATRSLEESTEPTNDTGLEKILDDFVKKQFAPMGVYVHDLETNSFAGAQETTTFKSASLYKLFVAYETLLRVDEDDLSLSQPTGYDAGNISIDDCLEVMITVSDNPCGRALRKVLDIDEKPIPRLAELGFSGTNLGYEYPTTSARDVALLFEKLYSQADLSEKSNQLLLTHLKNQQIKSRIPNGLPKGTEIAHKTGDLEGFAHDAGIVYHHNGDYVLVVLGGPWSGDVASVNSDYAELTKLIHEYLRSGDR